MDGPNRESRRLFIRRSACIVGGGLLLRGCDVPPATSPTVSRSPTGGTAPAASPAPSGGPATPDLTPPAFEPHIRVRLARARSSQATTRVSAGSTRTWLRIADRRGGPEQVMRSPVRVQSTPGGWSVVDGDGVRASLDPGEIEIGAVRGEPALLTLDGRPYPGSVVLVPRSEVNVGAYDVVNHTPIEVYLPGVLAKELYASWHRETFRAQAIAARSFACNEIAWWSGRRHYDVVAGQASQAYIGASAHARAYDAAADTRGILLLWQGRIVPAYYSSCCGGVSASAIDAISSHPVNDITPLTARPPHDCCREAPVWRWRSEQGATTAARRLQAWSRSTGRRMGGSLDDVATVEASALNAHGRPLRYRVTDSSGTAVELDAERFRTALNFSGDGLRSPRPPVRSSHFDAVRRGSTLRIEGRGFGHGVGLCQYGAESFARGGRHWREIVEHYYPGGEIRATYV